MAVAWMRLLSGIGCLSRSIQPKGNAGMGIGVYEGREFIRVMNGKIEVFSEPGARHNLYYQPATGHGGVARYYYYRVTPRHTDYAH